MSGGDRALACSRAGMDLLDPPHKAGGIYERNNDRLQKPASYIPAAGLVRPSPEPCLGGGQWRLYLSRQQQTSAGWCRSSHRARFVLAFMNSSPLFFRSCRPRSPDGRFFVILNSITEPAHRTQKYLICAAKPCNFFRIRVSWRASTRYTNRHPDTRLLFRKTLTQVISE